MSFNVFIVKQLSYHHKIARKGTKIFLHTQEKKGFLARLHFFSYFGHCLGESYCPYFLRMIHQFPRSYVRKMQPKNKKNSLASKLSPVFLFLCIFCSTFAAQFKQDK